MHRFIALLAALSLFCAIVIYRPESTSSPGASVRDPAKEDLSRVEYPSLASIEWTPRFVQPNETLESMFGKDWTTVARFNRIDRRHVYPGMTVKVPKDMAKARSYTPMPAEYEPAKGHEKYILVNLTEQWLGAYAYGKLVFSAPAASGANGHDTPTGVFQVDARHRNHTSSLYKTDAGDDQYPMDNAVRFYVGPDDVSYWLHARDLPGRPASHGCVGLYSEDMQKRVYDFPDKPVLNDSKKLYDWAVGDDVYEDPNSGDLELLEDGPMVEVVGHNPRYLDKPVHGFLAR